MWPKYSFCRYHKDEYQIAIKKTLPASTEEASTSTTISWYETVYFLHSTIRYYFLFILQTFWEAFSCHFFFLAGIWWSVSCPFIDIWEILKRTQVTGVAACRVNHLETRFTNHSFRYLAPHLSFYHPFPSLTTDSRNSNPSSFLAAHCPTWPTIALLCNALPYFAKLVLADHLPLAIHLLFSHPSPYYASQPHQPLISPYNHSFNFLAKHFPTRVVT